MYLLSPVFDYINEGYSLIITLLLILQKGERPDVVIFYDGVNDTYSAFQQLRAGLPQNEFNREIEFNLSKPEKKHLSKLEIMTNQKQ